MAYARGGEKGSQVYGRATWHREKWVVMYVWHFPRYHVDIYPADWEHVVLWLNNPAVANQTLEAVSVWEDEKGVYEKAVPPEAKFMDGSRIKLEMGKAEYSRSLRLTHLAGQSQPLIMWDQLSDNIQRALTSADWGIDIPMPLSDSRFTLALENAWPFAPVAQPPPAPDPQDE